MFVGRKFELSLVIAFQQSRAVWVIFLQVHVVYFRVIACVSTFFTDIHLMSSFLVREVERLVVHLLGVGFQGAALGERLVATVALVRTNT